MTTPGRQAPKRPAPVNGDEPTAKRAKLDPTATQADVVMIPEEMPDGGFPVLDGLPEPVRTRVEGYAKRLLGHLHTRPELVDELHHRYAAAAAEEAGDKELGEQVDTSGSLTTTKAVEKKVADKVEQEAGAKALSHTAKGKWLDNGVASGAVPKNNIRDRQLANQISAVVLQTDGKGSSEIEVMLINGRMLISANEKAVVANLHGKRLGDMIDGLNHAQLKPHVKSKARKLADLYDVLHGRNCPNGEKRLAQIAVDCLIWPKQQEPVKAALATLLADAPIVNGGPPANAAAALVATRHAGHVIAVDGEDAATKKQVSQKGPDGKVAKDSMGKTVMVTVAARTPKSHAEQNLVLTQVLAEHTGPSAVAGGKRPCTVCYLSLSLVRNQGFADLRFSNRSGGFWKTTTVGALTTIAKALRMDKDAMVMALDQIPFSTHYVTDLDRLAARSTPVARLRDALSLYNTKTVSPSQSQVDEDFIVDESEHSESEHAESASEDEDWFGEHSESDEAVEATDGAEGEPEDELDDEELDDVIDLEKVE
ncbi:hypothetical protein [Umezawaea sp.]|uniref:hypothetical protein n=1 Tax=Umezawaea sp. TaxID=1955258 RepID=UPI002ED423D9